jgi:hypothetical protein
MKRSLRRGSHWPRPANRVWLARGQIGRARGAGAILGAAALLGLSCLGWARAAAVDVKGSVRSDETPKQSSVQAVRAPYWQEWNGLIEPKKASVDYAREVSLVLIGPESMRDATIVELSNGTLTPSTIVAQHGTALRIRNQDDFTHKLYAEKLEKFDAVETSPGMTRELQLLQTGDFELKDRLLPHVHGYLHVLPKVSALANPQADGSYVFKDVHPGSYTLKVFRGAREVSSEPLEVKEGRDIVVDAIAVDARAKK